MTINVIVKQDKEVKTKIIDEVKHHYFDKNYLVVTLENQKKKFFKISTVLEIDEDVK